MVLPGWSQLVRSLHPAWRKERRVLQACEAAFKEGEYTLVRIHISTSRPSLTDVLPWSSGFLETPKYFTYDLETEGEPDFSGMSRAERRIVRRYLRRNADHVRHHGRQPVRPARTPQRETEEISSPSEGAAHSEMEAQTGSPEATEENVLQAPVTLKGRALWFGKIALRTNKIVVSGWTWRGPITQAIPLRDILMFETWAEREGSNFRVELNDGAPIRGRIREGIGLWEAQLDTDERVDLRRRVDY